MRTTITIEDSLYERALELADPEMDKADLFREAIKTYIRVRASERLIALGATKPEMNNITRKGNDIWWLSFSLLPRCDWTVFHLDDKNREIWILIKNKVQRLLDRIINFINYFYFYLASIKACVALSICTL